jgi:hypothetical protein
VRGPTAVAAPVPGASSEGVSKDCPLLPQVTGTYLRPPIAVLLWYVEYEK